LKLKSFLAGGKRLLPSRSREKERKMKRTFKLSLVAVCAVLFMEALPKAQAAPGCSASTLKGGYGFFVQAIILPNGIRRSILGRINFDSRGNFTNNLTFNEEGTVTHSTDVGTYIVNPDCTGRLLTNGGIRTIEIVIVEGGKEFLQLRTDDPHILFLFNVAKKQLASDD
jgi:hypothetical protein